MFVLTGSYTNHENQNWNPKQMVIHKDNSRHGRNNGLSERPRVLGMGYISGSPPTIHSVWLPGTRSTFSSLGLFCKHLNLDHSMALEEFFSQNWDTYLISGLKEWTLSINVRNQAYLVLCGVTVPQFGDLRTIKEEGERHLPLVPLICSTVTG